MTTTTHTTSSRTTTSASPTTCPRSSSARRLGRRGMLGHLRWRRRRRVGRLCRRLVELVELPSSSTTGGPPNGGPPAAGRRCPRRRLDGRRRRRRDPRGDGRSLPRRRLQRPQRAHRVGHRPLRHHRQLRRRQRCRRGRPADGQAQGLRPQRRPTSRRSSGAAIYLWHCDRDGNYSLYSEAAADENYLRGVQEAADDGSLEFTTIFPACYAGRWPHMHFEVYESLDAATSASNKLRTSQLALPQDVCETVYATEATSRASATWRRSASTATASSPTATPCRWPRSPAPSRTATSPPSTSPSDRARRSRKAVKAVTRP